MTKFKLGQRVRGGRPLMRSRINCGQYWAKRWEPSDWHPKPKGVYIGTRTYVQGRVEVDGDGQPEWWPEEQIKVGLIVTDPRQNPVPVMYDSLEEIT